MKIAYSTLACPSWDLDQIIDCARQCGYHGVDFRPETALPAYADFLKRFC